MFPAETPLPKSTQYSLKCILPGNAPPGQFGGVKILILATDRCSGKEMGFRGKALQTFLVSLEKFLQSKVNL